MYVIGDTPQEGEEEEEEEEVFPFPAPPHAPDPEEAEEAAAGETPVDHEAEPVAPHAADPEGEAAVGAAAGETPVDQEAEPEAPHGPPPAAAAVEAHVELGGTGATVTVLMPEAVDHGAQLSAVEVFFVSASTWLLEDDEAQSSHETALVVVDVVLAGSTHGVVFGVLELLDDEAQSSHETALVVVVVGSTGQSAAELLDVVGVGSTGQSATELVVVVVVVHAQVEVVVQVAGSMTLLDVLVQSSHDAAELELELEAGSTHGVSVVLDVQAQVVDVVGAPVVVVVYELLTEEVVMLLDDVVRLNGPFWKLYEVVVVVVVAVAAEELLVVAG